MTNNIQKLYYYCKTGNIKEFIKICDSYTDFNYNRNDERLLKICCNYGHINILNELYKRCPTINFRINDDYPFRIACANGYIDIANKLLEYDSNINIYNKNNYAFCKACQNEHLHIINEFYKWNKQKNNKFDNIIMNKILWCAKNNKLKILKLLCEHENHRLENEINYNNIFHNSLLIAIEYDNKEIISYLLSIYNLLNNDSIYFNLILNAFKKKNIKLITYIHNYKKDIITPLYLFNKSCKYDTPEIIELIILNYPEFIKTNILIDGFICACYNNCSLVVKYFIDKYLSSCIKNEIFNTPIISLCAIKSSLLKYYDVFLILCSELSNYIDISVLKNCFINCENNITCLNLIYEINNDIIKTPEFNYVFIKTCIHNRLNIMNKLYEWKPNILENKDIFLSGLYNARIHKSMDIINKLCCIKPNLVHLNIFKYYPRSYIDFLSMIESLNWIIDTIKNNDECVICTEICNNIVLTPCNHKFCQNCISIWLNKSNSCPYCRTKIC